MIIDSHAHINDERLKDEKEEIISTLGDSGIEKIIEVGYDFESSKAAYELSQKYDMIYSAVGIHPHDAKSRKESDYDYFRSVASNKKVVAIGEIGLDYFYDLSERDIQKKIFKEEIELADELKMPIIIHLRDAFGDIAEILKDMKRYLNSGVLIHCYTGSREFLHELNKYDCYYAFGGAVTFKNAHKEEVVRGVPIERLLIETDCPYMTPVPYRGKPNRPQYVTYVLQKLSEILNISYDELGKITYDNTLRLFPKMRGLV